MNGKTRRYIKRLLDLGLVPRETYRVRLHSGSYTVSELHVMREKKELPAHIELPPLTHENMDERLMYKRPVLGRVDVYRMFKKAYKDDPIDGLAKAIEKIGRDHRLLRERYPELFEEKEVESVSEGVLDIAKLRGKSFWKALVAFLFSFVAKFGSKKEEDEVKIESEESVGGE